MAASIYAFRPFFFDAYLIRISSRDHVTEGHMENANEDRSVLTHINELVKEEGLYGKKDID